MAPAEAHGTLELVMDSQAWPTTELHMQHSRTGTIEDCVASFSENFHDEARYQAAPRTPNGAAQRSSGV